MIPLVWAILIYQILAFLGVDAISHLVTYIAYKKQDIDTKLMYSQKPFEMIANHNKFKKNVFQKTLIFFLATIAILFNFIPTIFTKLNNSAEMYTKHTQAPLKLAEAPWSSAEELPVMDNVIVYLENLKGDPKIVDEVLNGYLKYSLHLNTTENPSGEWFGANAKPVVQYIDDQIGGMYGFNAGENRTFSAFGHRPSDYNEPTSSTLEACSTDPTIRITNLTDVSGFKIEGTRSYDFPCYPVFDRSTGIYRRNDIQYTSSILSVGDTIYRPPLLVHGVSAHASFGVSLFNHNKTHMSMGIKKMASITIYNYNDTIPLPSDCNPPGKTENATIDFKDLPSNRILCTLLDVLPPKGDRAQLGLYQARRRYYDEKNHALNAVYTTQNGHVYEEGQSVMVDLNMFAVYTIEGQLADEKEHLLAFETMQFEPSGLGVDLNDSMFAITLADNNLEHILNQLDSSVLDHEAITVLATLASIKARWTNNDFSDFTRYTADVTSAIETSVPWIIAVSVLFSVLLLFQVLRLPVRGNPYYTLDFRSIVISTVNNQGNGGNASEAKKIGLDFSPLGRKGLGATLTVNGNPIGEKQLDDNANKLKMERPASFA